MNLYRKETSIRSLISMRNNSKLLEIDFRTDYEVIRIQISLYIR